jgi:hypothetical protein
MSDLVKQENGHTSAATAILNASEEGVYLTLVNDCIPSSLAAGTFCLICSWRSFL